MSAVYLVVTIDTECDKGAGWEIQHPLRFRSVTEGIPDRLMPLFRRYGVKPTFLLSPEVIEDDASVAILKQLKNCELGTHLHGEFIEPERESQPARTKTPQADYAPSVERAKLLGLTRLFEDRLGYPPKSFRAGRFGMSPYTLQYLAELGYLVDTSVTPFRTHYFESGTVRNYWGAPVQPYFPSVKDARKSGKLPILEVPVTILKSSVSTWPRWLLRTMEDKSRWGQRGLRRLGLRDQAVWLRPVRTTPRQMFALVETLTSQAQSEHLVINLMFHNVEVMEGASPYAESEEQVQSILKDLDILFDHLRANYPLRTVLLTELYEHFANGNENV